ncbi:MAG: 3-hydroxyacyl-ACP dehydratase FabZ family protein [Planctomycetota bacterium]|nr:3-hydroxyacyl-ACP dehydratase FabZ family protein [Planctomycetota bacterium]
MPRPLLYDIDSVDLAPVQISGEAIREVIPQRYEFEQLDAIAYFNPDEEIAIGVRALDKDEFWTRGHMPGRPVFPGVLMLEAAAQLCSFYTCSVEGTGRIFGFGGANDVRFRRILSPGDTLHLLAKPERISSRRSLFLTQGVVDGQLAFEASILGIALPPAAQEAKNGGEAGI